MLFRHPRLLFLLPPGFALLAGVFALVRGPQYVARAELKPGAGDSRLASLAGLAAQFGVNPTALGPSESLDYYAAVLRSNEILREVVQTTYRFSTRSLQDSTGDSLSGTLMDIWKIRAPSAADREARAMRRLRASIAVRPNLAAGLLRLEVTARWPELTVQINRRFLDALEAFNLQNRQSQAAAQRRFVEGRLAEMRVELTAAEDALMAFESHNRLLQAPGLALERQRLQRKVDLNQQVYLTLAQAYEQARIDEVRDTPVIRVIDSPENTVERAGGLLLLLLLGGFVGLLVGIGLILLSELWVLQMAEHPHDARAILQAWRLIPLRLLRGNAADRGSSPAP
jgi:uncharacterized protein involved in exopolysaccharide biosynthesis